MSTKGVASAEHNKTANKHDQNTLKIFEKFKKFYNNNELTDIVLVVGRGTHCVSIHAHRVVLCALSEHFLAICRDPSQMYVREELKEIDGGILKSIIDFMYSGNIKLNLGNIENVFKAANLLKIRTLISCCKEFIKSNNYSIKRLSNKNTLPKRKALTRIMTSESTSPSASDSPLLRNKCDKPREEDIQAVMNVNDFKDMYLPKILNEHSVEDAVRHIIKWIHLDKTNREHYILHLLSMVPYQNLTSKFIVENMKAVRQTLESYYSIYSWLRIKLWTETQFVADINTKKVTSFQTDDNPETRSIDQQGDVELVKEETQKQQINSYQVNPVVNKFSYLNNQRQKISGIRDHMLVTLSMDTPTILKYEKVPPIQQHIPEMPLIDTNHSFVQNNNPVEQCIDQLGNSNRDKWPKFAVAQNHTPETSSIIQKENVKCDKLAFVQVSNSNRIRILTYYPQMDLWSLGKSVAIQKHKKSFSTIVIDTKMYLVGGKDSNGCLTNTVECLDLLTSEWTELPPMKYSRYSCQLAHSKGYLCVHNGFNGDNFENSLEIYNFSTSSWMHLQPPQPFQKMTQIIAHNGIIYSLDFYNGFLQSYELSSNTWDSQTVEKDSLENFGFAAIKNCLYVLGGDLETTVKCYNLLSKSWSNKARLPNEYANIKCTTFEGKILFYGEHDNDVDLDVQEFNIDKNTWKNLGTFEKSGSFHTSSIFVKNF